MACEPAASHWVLAVHQTQHRVLIARKSEELLGAWRQVQGDGCRDLQLVVLFGGKIAQDEAELDRSALLRARVSARTVPKPSTAL